MGGQLLGHDSGHGDHGEPAVVQLLVPHLQQSSGPTGSPVQRIEAEVAVLVAVFESRYPEALREGLVNGLPAPVDVDQLNYSAEAEYVGREGPEHVVSLLELVDGGAADPVPQQEGKLLPEEHSQGSEHSDSSVFELSLAVYLELPLGEVSREAQRVEEAERSGDSGVGGGVESTDVGGGHAKSVWRES